MRDRMSSIRARSGEGELASRMLMDLERLPGESGLDCGHPQMLGSSSALSAGAEERVAPVLTLPLPYRTTRMNNAKVGGPAGMGWEAGPPGGPRLHNGSL